MDEGEAFALRDGMRPLARIGEALALEDHGRAMGARALDLHERRQGRHDDRRRDAEALGVVGDRLGVVAGRHGDDAAPALLRPEARELVDRAALLEGAGRVHVLVLHEHRRAGELGQPRRRHQRRAQDVAGDRRGGAPDILDVDRKAAHGAVPQTWRGPSSFIPKNPPGRKTRTAISTE